MAVSRAKRISIAAYQQEKCDRLIADVPKGKREVYKRIAAELNLSLASLIQVGVEEYARAHAGEDWTANQLTATSMSTDEKPGETLSREEKKLLEDFRQMPANLQKHVRGLIQAINDAQAESD